MDRGRPARTREPLRVAEDKVAGIRPIPVVAAALVDAAGRVCLQQRPRDKQHGGLWEFPGGKVESGESPEQALRRELAEELAVRIEPADLTACGVAANDRIEIRLYLCRRWTGAATALEAEALIWLAPADVSALAMPPLDYPLAAQLLRHLSTATI